MGMRNGDGGSESRNGTMRPIPGRLCTFSARRLRIGHLAHNRIHWLAIVWASYSSAVAMTVENSESCTDKSLFVSK